MVHRFLVKTNLLRNIFMIYMVIGIIFVELSSFFVRYAHIIERYGLEKKIEDLSISLKKIDQNNPIIMLFVWTLLFAGYCAVCFFMGYFILDILNKG